MTPAQAAQLAAKVKRVGVLVEIDYTPTPMRAWTGRGNILWDGKTWLGIGDFGGVSAIQEKVGVRAHTVTLTLNGVPLEHVARAMLDTSSGREVRLWVATFTEAGGVWSVVDAPTLLLWGDTDVHEIIEDDRTCTISVLVDTPLARLTLMQVLRYTHADQQRLFPGDRGFEFAEQVAEQVLYWPTPEPQRATSPGGGGIDGGSQSDMD